MRKSLELFIEECYDVKCYLQTSGYELHEYADGSYADFPTTQIIDVASIAAITKGFDAKVLLTKSGLTIRIYENFLE